MNNSLRSRLPKHLDLIRDLQFLEEIEQNPRVSQRELSNKFGIALGVTNACIKRMVRRGLIRLKGIPPRRVAYYLTPKGFSEKSKLMVHFFSYNVRHYAEMKKAIAKRLLEMEESGVRKVAFYGISDEMEIAYITLQGSPIRLAGIIDGNEVEKGRRIFGEKVIWWEDLKNLKVDAILITSIGEDPDSLRTRMKQMGLDAVHVWQI